MDCFICTRLETFFIGLCVALGHMDGKPFSVAKIAAYMRVPRSTVIRRLDRLQRWGLIYRQGRRYLEDQIPFAASQWSAATMAVYLAINRVGWIESDA